MSLLSINRLTLYLSSCGVAGLARSRLGLGGIKGSACVAHERLSADSAALDLSALQEVLRQLGRGAVEIILSSHFVRYQIFPWQASLESLDEELGFARFAFTQTYGSAAKNWRVTLSDEAPEVTRVAAALDNELLDQLAGAVKAMGSTLVAVRPSLMPLVNFGLPAMDDKSPNWFLAHEDGVLTMAMLDQGAWRWVRTRRVGEDWFEQWHDIIADESILSCQPLDAARVHVFAPEISQAGESRVGNVVMSVLALPEGPSSAGVNDARLVFARIA